MLTKLSHIFGITGSALAMLPYVLVIGRSVINLIFYPDVLYLIPPELLILRYTAPALLSSAGFIASFFVRKKPVFAGAVMILCYTVNSFFPYSGLPDVPINAARVLSALLLVSAGVLAFISASGNGPHEKRNPLLNLSRIAALFCAALNTLLWVIISIYALCSMPTTDKLLLSLCPLFVSAAGLWGCLILRKHPSPGAMLMLVSGALIFLFSLVPRWLGVMDLWYGIPSLLLTAAGALILISRFTAGKASSGSEPANENPDTAVNG